jgi:hypothetical protein
MCKEIPKSLKTKLFIYIMADEDFIITDTQERDIFKVNNPQGNSTFWIVIKRYFDSVFMRGYDKNTNIMNDNFILVSLVDLNNDYTYFAEILLVEENVDL